MYMYIKCIYVHMLHRFKSKIVDNRLGVVFKKQSAAEDIIVAMRNCFGSFD